MKFSELIRLLEENEFRLVKEKGNIKGCRYKERRDKMIELPYSLIIEATEEPDYFGFYSPDLEGFTGIGHSVEDCIYKAKWGMIEHINMLKEMGLPIPPKNPNPKVIVQNEEKLVAA